MPQVRILSSRPNKNESYDTIGIATFVLFFLSKMPVAQGVSAMGHKRIISLCHSLALTSVLFRGVLTPCSAAEIHTETFLKRIISL
jgi:predicted transporter